MKSPSLKAFHHKLKNSELYHPWFLPITVLPVASSVVGLLTPFTMVGSMVCVGVEVYLCGLGYKLFDASPGQLLL